MQLLKVCYTVSEEKPAFNDEDATTNVKWEHDDFCRSYLNCLADHLADVYSCQPSARDIWIVVEEQYKDEKLFKTHLIDKFLNFKFEDVKEILPQVKELKKLVMKLKDEITLCDAFIVGAIVNMLNLFITLWQ